MGSPKMQSSHQCSDCPKSYKSLSHLHRHQTTHRPKLPFACAFCLREFARTDTMRRHAQRCSQRNNRRLPGRNKRGPKSTACERCARAKVACNKEHPCARCQQSDSACHYALLESTQPSASTRRVNIETTSPKPTDRRTLPFQRPARSKMAIPFLLTYADPQNSFCDFRNTTGPSSTLAQRSPGYNHGIPSLGGQITDPADYVPSSLYLDGFWDLFGWHDTTDCQERSMGSHTRSWIFDLPEDPLQDRVNRALDDLQDFEEGFRQRNSNSEPSDIDQFRHEMSTQTLCITIDAYFEFVHHNFPLVHPPSFDPHNISTHLLLAIYIAGSLVLSPRCRQSINLVQRFIFETDAIDDIIFKKSTLPVQTKMEILQAAAIIISADVVTDSWLVQQRICDQYFPKLLSAVRVLSLTSIRNDWDIPSRMGIETDYEAFVQNEIMVRITAMTFLLDGQFLIFRRIHPRLSPAEMTGGLPCVDEHFATNFGSQSEMHQLAMARPTRLSLSELINILMRPVWHGIDSEEMRGLNIRSLFMGISGLHNIIFTAQKNQTILYLSDRIKTALSRWRELWDDLMERTTDQQRHEVGFMKYAMEFWWLAEAMLRVDHEGLSMGHTALWSRESLHEGLVRLQRTGLTQKA